MASDGNLTRETSVVFTTRKTPEQEKGGGDNAGNKQGVKSAALALDVERGVDVLGCLEGRRKESCVICNTY